MYGVYKCVVMWELGITNICMKKVIVYKEDGSYNLNERKCSCEIIICIYTLLFCLLCIEESVVKYVQFVSNSVYGQICHIMFWA